MFDSTLLFVDPGKEGKKDLPEYLKSISQNFKKLIISTKDIEKYNNMDCEIIIPGNKDSFFQRIYTGLFFADTENLIATGPEINFYVEDELSVLMKNLHKGVDAALYIKDGAIQPFPGAYSHRIINKFKDTDAEKIESSFLKRLKINRINI